MISARYYEDPKSFLCPSRSPYSIFIYMHRKPIADSVVKASDVLTGRMLDIGCGTRPYASLLHCAEYIGIDIAASGRTVDIVYDGINLPFPDETFDSAICTEVLEHSPNPFALAFQIARVLKPDAFALITCPMVFHHHEEPRDYFRFTRYGMAALAKSVNLDVIWIASRGGPFITALSTVYTAVTSRLSRRPLIDLALLFLWPMAILALRFEKAPEPAMSLGWQMCVRKRRVVS